MSLRPTDNQSIEVIVCFCYANGRDTRHWLLMLRPRGADTGTWIHVTGGPATDRRYKLEIQANKRLYSHGIESRQRIGTITQADTRKVVDAARRQPLQRCQRWTTALCGDLEARGLVDPGTQASLSMKIQESRHEHIPANEPGGRSVYPNGMVRMPGGWSEVPNKRKQKSRGCTIM